MPKIIRLMIETKDPIIQPSSNIECLHWTIKLPNGFVSSFDIYAFLKIIK